jgi:hypothetical protein
MLVLEGFRHALDNYFYLFYTWYMFFQSHPYSFRMLDVFMKLHMKIFVLSNLTPYVVVDG